ncbi:hypothetical protein [Streptantibioticus silvisoli]|uniref:Uncharacterized protein n=1 Tax=Streptantibioticus silvisoli TaxID=2705255 RepID=A0ABT6VSG6_9ACTN|nr:hypothetical protein [Streptantibioticus silvisoli]MDI5961424.1 hypothetical protein [Streptantibioticus silvisoli]
MTDISTAGRALLAAAGSALLLGAAGAPALADDFDGRHLSVNQGAECAVRDVGLTGEHVLATGALPKAFNGVHAGPGSDGVRALCHAVDPDAAPRPAHAERPAAKAPAAKAPARHAAQPAAAHTAEHATGHTAAHAPGHAAKHTAAHATGRTAEHATGHTAAHASGHTAEHAARPAGRHARPRQAGPARPAHVVQGARQAPPKPAGLLGGGALGQVSGLLGGLPAGGGRVPLGG